MGGPYFQRTSWKTFIYQNKTYDLSHLDEYAFSIVDSSGNERDIVVTFTDHCFTRDYRPGDDARLLMDDCSRRKGVFDLERYELSLGIREHINRSTVGKVWNVEGTSKAVFPTVDVNGQPTLYQIVFELKKVTGLPVDLRMFVSTAFARTQGSLQTYGEIRFAHLVRLVMENKPIPRITDRRRRQPQIGNVKQR